MDDKERKLMVDLIFRDQELPYVIHCDDINQTDDVIEFLIEHDDDEAGRLVAVAAPGDVILMRVNYNDD